LFPITALLLLVRSNSPPVPISALRLILAAAFLQTSFADLKVVCIGDSITQPNGFVDANGGYSYRYWLWKSMVENGYEVDFVGSHNYNWITNPPSSWPEVGGLFFDNDNEGHSGWRADEIIFGTTRPEIRPTGLFGSSGSGYLAGWLSTYTADIAFLHIGTNDCLQGQGHPQTANEVITIIRIIQAYNPNATIFVATLITTSNAAANTHIYNLNFTIFNALPTLSTETSQVTLVDLTTPFFPSIHTWDGIHPNAAGEQIMADQFFAAFSDTIPLPPEALFQAWLDSFPTLSEDDRTPESDPDRDGVPNLSEYSAGGNPTRAETDLFRLTPTPNGTDTQSVTVQFKRTENLADLGLTQYFEASPKLDTTGNWVQVPAEELEIVPLENDSEHVTARLSLPSGISGETHPTYFFRLRTAIPSSDP